MSKTFTVTEARKDLYNLTKKASKPGQRIRIALKNGETVSLMSDDDIESMLETIEIMSDPQLVKDIKEAEKEKGGKPLEQVFQELGWD